MKDKAHCADLLVGGTGVGKSSALELVGNVPVDNNIHGYDFGILDHTNEQGGLNNQSQTDSAWSKNGITVGSGAYEHAEICDLAPRFASLIYLAWPTLEFSIRPGRRTI